MIIYGWKATHIKSQTAPNLTCANCNEKGKTFFSVFSKHVHIFWIPIFPYGKTGASQCEHCNVVYEKGQMPAEYLQEYERVKAEAKTPVWKYAGLIIIAALALYFYISDGQRDNRNSSYIESPLPGDIYRMKADNGHFTTMKVDSVGMDTLYIFVNRYQIKPRKELKDIMSDTSYWPFSLPFAKIEIDSMFLNEEIYDVDRD